MTETPWAACLRRALCRRPDARARLAGSPAYPQIQGEVQFFQTRWGTLVAAELSGLPEEEGESGIFAFHLHSGDQCAGDQEDPFRDADGHYNPLDRPHPQHAGDLPPLFSNGGRAFQVVWTDRFTVAQALGRTVIVHRRPDDFTTQPSGNAGEKIACGVVHRG